MREKETGSDDRLLEEGDSEKMKNGSPHLVDFRAFLLLGGKETEQQVRNMLDMV